MLKTKFRGVSKFEFNHQTNSLFIHQPGSPRLAITKTFTTNWGSPGFVLEPDSHWITFTIYPDKIRAFYKQVQIPSQEHIWKLQDIKYYQKDLPKTNPLIFTFEPTDTVHKVDGIWVKK